MSLLAIPRFGSYVGFVGGRPLETQVYRDFQERYLHTFSLPILKFLQADIISVCSDAETV
jgi:hypothetical protein